MEGVELSTFDAMENRVEAITAGRRVPTKEEIAECSRRMQAGEKISMADIMGLHVTRH